MFKSAAVSQCLKLQPGSEMFNSLTDICAIPKYFFLQIVLFRNPCLLPYQHIKKNSLEVTQVFHSILKRHSPDHERALLTNEYLLSFSSGCSHRMKDSCSPSLSWVQMQRTDSGGDPSELSFSLMSEKMKGNNNANVVRVNRGTAVIETMQCFVLFPPLQLSSLVLCAICCILTLCCWSTGQTYSIRLLFFIRTNVLSFTAVSGETWPLMSALARFHASQGSTNHVEPHLTLLFPTDTQCPEQRRFWPSSEWRPVLRGLLQLSWR